MPPLTEIRPLDPATDLSAVVALYRKAADYVLLETGQDPTDDLAAEFFTDAPPGGDPADGLKLGLYVEGQLAGIADLAFGWPEARDAYLGLMILRPDARGQGFGATFLRHIEAAARTRGAPRLYLAVLDENPRGMAFWQREGFAICKTFPPARIGQRDHIRHRMTKRL
jgi:GNAT superfamily N-acetyltransferase